MRSFRKLVLALAVTAVLAPATAFAQTNAADVQTTKDGVIYKFGDDGLLGGTIGADTARITVRPKASRATLVRPRTHFVPEMLRSVEAL